MTLRSATSTGNGNRTDADRLGAARGSSDTAALANILQRADRVPESASNTVGVTLDASVEAEGPSDDSRRWPRQISLDEAYLRLNDSAAADPPLEQPLSRHAQQATERHRACSAFYLKGRTRLQRVALVGNGPLTDEQRGEIAGSDLVVRFNKMNNR